MNPLGLLSRLNPVTMQAKLIAVLVVAVVGFGAGWSANGWRVGKSLEKSKGLVNSLSLSMKFLKEENQRSAAQFRELERSNAEFFADLERRNQVAAAARLKAEEEAAVHKAAAAAAQSRPPAPVGKECEVLAREAIDYVNRRRQ